MILTTLIGSSSRTSFKQLDYKFHDDFEAGSSHLYVIKDKDVGDILCIKIHWQPTGKKLNEWFLSHVTVATEDKSKEKNVQTFPCYRWLTDEVTMVTLTEGSGKQ